MKLHLDVKKVDFDSNYNIIATRNTVRVSVDAIFEDNIDYITKMHNQQLEEVYLPMSFTRVLVLYEAWISDTPSSSEHIPSHEMIYNITFGCKDFDIITMDEYRKIPGATYT